MNRMEIKGLVIGTKITRENENAILVVQADGQIAIVVGDGKSFDYKVNQLAQGDWLCVHGTATEQGSIVRFENSEVAVGEQVVKGDGAVRIMCTNYCDGETTSGWCFETAEQSWFQIAKAYGKACQLAEANAN